MKHLTGEASGVRLHVTRLEVGRPPLPIHDRPEYRLTCAPVMIRLARRFQTPSRPAIPPADCPYRAGQTSRPAVIKRQALVLAPIAMCNAAGHDRLSEQADAGHRTSLKPS